MKIKKGDNVIVRTGKDKGTTGVVIKAMPKTNQVIVEGVNIKKKHIRVQQGEGIVDMAKPIDVSNVMIVDPKTKKASRIGKKKVGEKYVRIAVKSGQEI
jgi:large subunit ribosomal protein L24